MTRATDAKGGVKRRDIEPGIHKVLSHPVRWAVWVLLGDAPYNRSELADALDQNEKRVSEAITFLHKEKLIEIVAEPSGEKGGRVPVYRARRYIFSLDDWTAVPRVERELASYEILRLLSQEISASLASGLFDSHAHRTLIRRPVWLDDEGAAEVDRALSQADDQVAEAEMRSAGRLALSGDAPQRFISASVSAPARAS